MDGDTILMLTYLCKDLFLHKIVVKINESDTSSENTDTFLYYREDGNLDKIKSLLPEHISSHIHSIVEVQTNIFDVVEI